jgi:hypothetical protein
MVEIAVVRRTMIVEIKFEEIRADLPDLPSSPTDAGLYTREWLEQHVKHQLCYDGTSSVFDHEATEVSVLMLLEHGEVAP